MSRISGALLAAVLVVAAAVTVGAIASAQPQSVTAAPGGGVQARQFAASSPPPVTAAATTPTATTPRTVSPTTPAPTGVAAAALDAAQGAAGALFEAGGIGSRLQLGAAVLDVTTGELAVGPAGNDPYYAASVVKLIVAVDIVDRAAAGEIVLSEQDIDLINRMLSVSDDDAMNTMWVRYDGAGGVTRVSARLGLTGTTTPTDAAQWGSTLITAHDVALVYLHVLTDADTVGRDLIMTALYASASNGADGFNQVFGLWGNGDGVKQGWQCCYDNTKQLHSTGVVDGRYIAVLLTNRSSSVSWDDSRAQVTTIAVALQGALPG